MLAAVSADSAEMRQGWQTGRSGSRGPWPLLTSAPLWGLCPCPQTLTSKNVASRGLRGQALGEFQAAAGTLGPGGCSGVEREWAWGTVAWRPFSLEQGCEGPRSPEETQAQRGSGSKEAGAP